MTENNKKTLFTRTKKAATKDVNIGKKTGSYKGTDTADQKVSCILFQNLKNMEDRVNLLSVGE